MNGQACPVDADVTFEYAPEEIGEQILEFEIAAGKASAKARAYMDGVKNIVVTSVVEGCFTIDGAGEHNVEGETVTLALVNEDLFNFEVEGWYDPSGQLLSGEATYAPVSYTHLVFGIQREAQDAIRRTQETQRII